MFKRGSDEEVNKAVEKQILGTKYSSKKCFIASKPSEVHKEPGNAYFITRIADTTVKSAEDKPSCPLPYSDPGNTSYFLYDELHPEMFIYVGGGQFGILLSDKTQWSDTIRFIR